MVSNAFNFIADDDHYKRDALILKKKLTRTPVGADLSCTPPIHRPLVQVLIFRLWLGA
jgi:hypothetical protein